MALRLRKSGAEMSLNVIIIAVLALLVLVVMVYFIANSATGVNKGTNCPAKGGYCSENSCDNGIISDGTCGSTSENCCRLVPS